MLKKLIFFDFDGVIVDSFRTAFEVQKMICPWLTEDEYRQLFEGNINDWQASKVVSGKEYHHEIDFFTEYTLRMKNEVHIFAGMKEIIVELAKSFNLVVISSNITSPIREFLKKYDLADHFVEIMGNDVHKSKVEKIKMVFEKYSVGAGDCVFVTDTLGDMHEAERMKLATIGVTWGFHEPEILLLGKPFKLVESPAGLLGVINDYFEVFNVD